MTNRLSSAPIRRTVVLALLTAGLHVLALLVVAHQLRAAGAVHARPPVMEARLIAATPPPPKQAPANSAPKPLPRPRSVPPPPPPSSSLAENADAPAPAALEPDLSAPAVDTGAAGRLADVESIQLAAPAEKGEGKAEAKAEVLVGRAYRADVPPSSRILLDVARKDADGTLWHGEAAMAWQQDGGSYRMKLEAGIRVLVTRVNLVVLESSGKIDGAGFVPRTMLEKRRGRAQTATQFGDGGDKITFSSSAASFSLAPGTQDKATVPLQLAAIARADSEQLKGNIDMLVGEDKDASVFRFVLLGQESITTPLGRLDTWHLSRPPRFNAYNSRLDIWLAPSLGWLPVRIDNIESSGASTTQTVKHIDRPGAG